MMFATEPNWWANTIDTSSNALTFNFDDSITSATTEFYLPDPLIDWLPNSCLYTKYLPTWHLVKSYSKHECEPAFFDEKQGIYDWFCKYCRRMMR